MPYCKKIPTYLGNKILKKTFFIYVDKKKIKDLSEKSFCVFNEPPQNTIIHTKTCLAKSLIIFINVHEKGTLYHLKTKKNKGICIQ